MAPIRRYLRITPASVLEVRIYLDNPADASRWLLNEKTPMLARVVEAVRPLILPKLREENENARVGRGGVVRKKGKRKGVKDVVVTDEFEVSIFLTELSTRHSILTRRKVFKSQKPRLGSGAGKMTGETREAPVEIGGDAADEVVIGEEEEDEDAKDGLRLRDILAAAADDNGKDAGTRAQERGTRTTKKRRRGPSSDEEAPQDEEEEEEGEGLFLSDDDSGSSDAHFQTQRAPRSEAHKPTATTAAAANEEDGAADDEKKKMALDTTYDGYAIYGRILCLIVKRRGLVRGKEVQGGTGQAVMEEWVRSTQVGGGEEGE